VEPVKRALGVPVHLADAEGVVAGLAEHARQLVPVLGGDAAVAEHAVVPRRQAGQQGRPRRRARRRARVGVPEQHALARDPIQVGRLDRGIAVGADAVAAVLVGHEKQDVRPPPRGLARRLPSRRQGRRTHADLQYVPAAVLRPAAVRPLRPIFTHACTPFGALRRPECTLARPSAASSSPSADGRVARLTSTSSLAAPSTHEQPHSRERRRQALRPSLECGVRAPGMRPAAA